MPQRKTDRKDADMDDLDQIFLDLGMTTLREAIYAQLLSTSGLVLRMARTMAGANGTGRVKKRG